MQPKKICAYSGCTKLFRGKTKRHIYCSEHCARLAFKEQQARKPKDCKWCGAPTTNKNRLCSEYCAQAYAHSKSTHQNKTKADFPSIEETVRLAREVGLSYGQYVGKLYSTNERNK